MALAGFNRLSYTHDTIIGDFNAQVIDLYSAIQYPQPPPGPTFGGPPYTSYTAVALITRSDSEVVFALSGSVWDTLYWFGAEPGEHWFPAHINDPTCAPVTVEDTGTTVVDGVPLRTIETTDGSPSSNGSAPLGTWACTAPTGSLMDRRACVVTVITGSPIN
jgi:hypothetical protein